MHARPVSTQETFTRSISLCAIDMTFSELSALVAKVQEFHRNANRDMTDEYMHETLTLQDEFSKYEIKQDFSMEAIARGPDRAIRVWYDFVMPDHSPIAKIDLRLGDSRRSLVISGANKNLVDSLVLLVEEQISKVGCSFGGSETRSTYGLVIWLSGFILAWLPLIFPIRRKYASSKFALPTYVSLVISIASIGLIMSVFVFPWSDWFPGAVIRKHSISTWIALSPYVTVLGVLVGLASLVVSIVYVRSRRTK